MKENREFYWEKENLENSTIKSIQKLFNERFKFLFIGQGQVDTWQPHISLLEPSKFRNLEFSIKIMISHELLRFHMKRINFTWSYEISGATTTFSPFRITRRNFRMFMQNQLRHHPYTAIDFSCLVHFAQSCESATFDFWASFYHFFHFLLLIPP